MEKMLLRPLGKTSKTTVCGNKPGEGKRPILFNKVPYTAALGIVQEAPLPKHKCDDIQSKKENCKQHSERLNDTYSVAKKQRHENLFLDKDSLNITTISML